MYAGPDNIFLDNVVVREVQGQPTSEIIESYQVIMRICKMYAWVYSIISNSTISWIEHPDCRNVSTQIKVLDGNIDAVY